jgi:tRNA(Arg) A34 adenosine deaminase TadA
MCLYVYRIRKTKEFGMARPCPSCMQAIKDFGIRTIFYTTDDGYAEEHLF